MLKTATARRAHAMLAAAARLKGKDSPEYEAARRAYLVTSLASDATHLQAELGELTPTERTVILAALDHGREVSVDA